jgi:hypothetical protein
VLLFSLESPVLFVLKPTGDLFIIGLFLPLTFLRVYVVGGLTDGLRLSKS